MYSARVGRAAISVCLSAAVSFIMFFLFDDGKKTTQYCMRTCFGVQ